MPINSTETNKVQFENAVFLPEIVKMLNEGHTVTLTLRGNSMHPFLEDCRDKALFVKPTTIAVGDPVLAEIAPKHFVLHRIVRIDGDRYTLQGDGNWRGVEHCTRADIIAKAVAFYRKGHAHPLRTDSRTWRCYSRLWVALRPVRRILLGLYRRWRALCPA